jgi:DNA repair and recombination protein RAD52
MIERFTNEQVAALSAPLNLRHVAHRTQSGRTLSYIEGWHAIAEANRIFGFSGWNRETIEMREVRPPELVKNSSGKETWRVGFICRVRVTVGLVVREGTGFGSGALPDLGDAYESAAKEAETDAMKRALMTFGNPFGLALYDKERTNVIADAPEPPAAAPRLTKASGRDLYARMEKALRDIDSSSGVENWSLDGRVDAALKSLPEDWEATLREEIFARFEKLHAAELEAEPK